MPNFYVQSRYAVLYSSVFHWCLCLDIQYVCYRTIQYMLGTLHAHRKVTVYCSNCRCL
jgi:hypothetical protein